MSEQEKWLVVKQSQIEPVTWWIDHGNIVLGPYIEQVAEMTAYHLNALGTRLEAAEAKEALADEEWAGEEDGFISDVSGLGLKTERCEVCYASQRGQLFGHRPFKHRSGCRKIRYDALNHPDALTGGCR